MTDNTIQSGLKNIAEGNLVEMKSNFFKALSEKAMVKLEEKKIKIAKAYFGKQ